MILISNEEIAEKKGRVLLLSNETPASTSISGADIEGMPADYVFAVGSRMITPDADYIALEDGVFTAKSSGGGGGGSALLVTLDENWQFDKTWNEVKTAVLGGVPAYILAAESEDDYVEIQMMPIIFIGHDDGTYDIHAVTTGVTPQTLIFSADSADGYPAFVSH